MESNKRVSKNQLIIIAITSILIIAGIIGGKIYSEKKYQKKLIETAEEIINLGADSEKITNNFIGLWGEKINDKSTKKWTRDYIARRLGVDVKIFVGNTTPFEFYDEALSFNDVLRCYKEYNTKMLINDRLINRREIVELGVMGLNNTPSKFKKSYDSLVEMYTNVSSYVSLATNPTGSLNSYRNETNNLSNNIVNEYTIFKTQIPN